MERMLTGALFLAAAVLAAAATTCEDLAKLQLANTTIDTAISVPAGDYQVPGGPSVRTRAAFCRAAGVMKPSSDSHITLEVWMPASGWNGKFLGIGNGGFAGAVSYPALAAAVSRGYAAAATDTGHRAGGQDARWALDHPEKIVDFGYRAIHETAVKGKAVAQAFFGKAASKSYFVSCSNGGRQALMEAQRFPEDYDGIVAGAPANYWTKLLISAAWGAKALAEPGAYIPSSKLPALQTAVRSACDGIDGLKDGLLDDPSRCRFDPASIQCKSDDGDSCLTGPQVAALRKIYSGPLDGMGKSLFPSISPGGEAEPGGWGPWITGAAPERSSMYAFSTQFFKNMVFSDSNWDYKTFDVDRDGAIATKKMGPILNSVDPDLRRFHARGGKLILYHGWCDAAIPAQNSIDYYNSVVKKLGAKRTGEFVRLFLAPGVQHCGGGSAPNSFGQAGPSGGDPDKDVSAALERWVEQDVAPERIVAAQYKGQNPAAGIERTRPLCAYPSVARHKGGDANDAANFTCSAPK